MARFNQSRFNRSPWDGSTPQPIPVSTGYLIINARSFVIALNHVRSFEVNPLSTTKDRIESIAAGADVRIERTYTITPPGVTLTKAYLTIEKRDGTTPGRVQKVITGGLGAGGQITDGNTDNGVITMFFILTSADTIQFEPHRAYPFDIQGIDAEGKVCPLSVEGEFIPLRRSTVEVA